MAERILVSRPFPHGVVLRELSRKPPPGVRKYLGFLQICAMCLTVGITIVYNCLLVFIYIYTYDI